MTKWQILSSIIVNGVKWLWNPSESFVIYFCGPEDAQRSIPSILTYKNVALIFIYFVTICQQKTKDSAPSGSFQHNLRHRCFYNKKIDVCRFSSPVSSNNYGLIFNNVHFSPNCIFAFSAKHPFILTESFVLKIPWLTLVSSNFGIHLDNSEWRIQDGCWFQFLFSNKRRHHNITAVWRLINYMLASFLILLTI